MPTNSPSEISAPENRCRPLVTQYPNGDRLLRHESEIDEYITRNRELDDIEPGLHKPRDQV